MRKTLVALILVIIFSCQSKILVGNYQCVPCDLECDELSFNEDGDCPHCGMSLIKKIDPKAVGQIIIQKGSGNFFISGGENNKDKLIRIFYHMPKNYDANSPILFVVPGTGRNADSYRDSWIKISEQYGVLISSPMYFEKDYSYSEYHLAGLLKGFDINSATNRIDGTNKYVLSEEATTFLPNTKEERWLFNDFDRLFDLVVEEIKSNQNTYDIFGHSAGGQILHRFALFQTESKANKIIAANSGWYTMPDISLSIPFGLKNSTIDIIRLKKALSKSLIIQLGEKDNANTQGGNLLVSKTINKQGLGRLERGEYFYSRAKEIADSLNTEFNWKKEVVPNVGHEQQKMGVYAASLLYEVD